MTFSAAWIRGVLRRDLGFAGIVFSDDLSMGAARGALGSPEARVEAALAAGCDAALVMNDRAALVRVLDGWRPAEVPATRDLGRLRPSSRPRAPERDYHAARALLREHLGLRTLGLESLRGREHVRVRPRGRSLPTTTKDEHRMERSDSDSKALDGVRVLDLTQFEAGPLLHRGARLARRGRGQGREPGRWRSGPAGVDRHPRARLALLPAAQREQAQHHLRSQVSRRGARSWRR